MATPAAVSTEDDGSLNGWRDMASCRGMSVDIFFPLGSPGVPEYDEAAKRAKNICNRCPVRRECLDYAVRTLGTGTSNDDLGIYGGLTFAERRSSHRRRLAADRGTRV